MLIFIPRDRSVDWFRRTQNFKNLYSRNAYAVRNNFRPIGVRRSKLFTPSSSRLNSFPQNVSRACNRQKSIRIIF